MTAVLNLDTSVAFLTPVLLAAARRSRRGGGEGSARPLGLEIPLLYGCLIMSNAASMLLPGSNLTNLIVLGRLHLSGDAFASRMAPAWALCVVVTGTVVGVAHRRQLHGSRRSSSRSDHPRPGPIGLLAVVAVAALVLALASPALPVLGVGILAVAVVGGRRRAGRQTVAQAAAGLPVLIGLLGIAVAAGTVARAWDGPAWLLGHLDSWGATALAAGLSVAVNNLPAASLLSARTFGHPFSVLVGLDLGPNLAVSGSLSSILWWQAARRLGRRPSVGEVSRLGLLSAPLAMAGALLVLAATGSR